MIRWIQSYVQGVSPVIIDGTLYALIGAFSFMQAYLSGEEAYKYVNPYALYWIKFAIGSAAAVFGSLKMFRSNTYAEHTKKKTESNNNPNSPTPIP